MDIQTDVCIHYHIQDRPGKLTVLRAGGEGGPSLQAKLNRGVYPAEQVLRAMNRYLLTVDRLEIQSGGNLNRRSPPNRPFIGSSDERPSASSVQAVRYHRTWHRTKDPFLLHTIERV